MEDFLRILDFAISVFKEHAGFAILFTLFGYVTWWIWRRYSKMVSRVQSLEAAIYGGGAYFQKDSRNGIITFANPALAALIGNKLSAKEIVGRPIAQVFAREVVETMLDMDDRLSRHDEVVENNIVINGNSCTLAKRQTSLADYWFVQVHIHKQDRISV